jgi:hypothetical protein
VDAEVYSPKDLTCTGCYLAHAEMQWGLSKSLFSQSNVIYALGGGYFDLGAGLVRAGRFGPAVEAGLMLNPWQPFKLRFKANANGDLFQPYREPIFGTFGLDQSYAWSAHWESRLEGRHVFTAGASDKSVPVYYDAKLSLQYYF